MILQFLTAHAFRKTSFDYLKNKYPRTPPENLYWKYSMQICNVFGCSVWGLHSTINSTLENSPEQLSSSKLKVKLVIIFIWKFVTY